LKSLAGYFQNDFRQMLENGDITKTELKATLRGFNLEYEYIQAEIHGIKDRINGLIPQLSEEIKANENNETL